MMRISGLATGMDTEKIIADLMKAQRIPLDKITQKKQYMQWQMDDYRETNRNLKATSDKIFNTVMKQSSFIAKNVNISNPDAVGIKNKNSTSEFQGTIEVTQLATQATWQSGGKVTLGTDQSENSTLAALGITGNSITISAVDKNGAIVTGQPIEINPANDTMKSLIEKINKDPGVTAFFDSQTGKIALSAKNSGAGTIGVVGDLKINGGELLGQDMKSSAGVNAKFNFNGLETERSSNTFDINGFEINLKQANTGRVTFSSSPDTDKIVDVVSQFVNDYNKMIEELNDKIREPKYRTFQPLSDEQKKDMKENEIKLWEEKAMSGTLRNDPEISSMLTKLRTLMTSTVMGGPDGKTKLSMKDLGIMPSKSHTENGKLTIDETKLRKAISDNPNNLYELFAKSAKPADGVSPADPGGLARQFKTAIDGSSKVISAKAGSVGLINDTFTMGRTMKDINSQITKFEDRLKMVESRYWKQFNAMENAIQRANAQSAGLMSALGGGA